MSIHHQYSFKLFDCRHFHPCQPRVRKQAPFGPVNISTFTPVYTTTWNSDRLKLKPSLPFNSTSVVLKLMEMASEHCWAFKIHLIYPKNIAAEDMQCMGPSGETHYEVFDFLGAFTNVISIPDWPHCMDPGCMFFLLAGICIRLDPYVSINFSALHFHGGDQSLHIHGGTPSLHFHRGSLPMVTMDTTLKGWDSHYVRVDYPPENHAWRRRSISFRPSTRQQRHDLHDTRNGPARVSTTMNLCQIQPKNMF